MSSKWNVNFTAVVYQKNWLSPVAFISRGTRFHSVLDENEAGPIPISGIVSIAGILFSRSKEQQEREV